MQFVPTPDQDALRDELRRLLAKRFDADRRRAAIELPGSVDRELWRELGDTGVFALTLAEADGGVGLGYADATIVFEELGRAAVPGPLVATFLAAGLVDGAAAGERVVGMVDAATPAFVEHLDALDALVVLDDAGLALVDPADVVGDLLGRPLDPLTPVHLVARLPDREPVGDGSAARRWSRDGGLLAAALQVGLGAAAVAMAVDYAKERQQFGKAIGSFQSIKHLLADAHTAIELARVAVQAAGVAIDEEVPDGDARTAVASARLVASRASHLATTTSIQVHGGMGYTWELDAHLFLKRVMVLDLAPGSVEAAIDDRAAAMV